MENFIKLANALLAGDTTAALIVVLLVGIGGLVYAIVKIWKHSNGQADHIRSITQDYINRIDSIMDTQQKNQSVTLDALRDIRVVLAELKGKLN